MRHIIKRQILQTEVPRSMKVFEVQQRISRFYYDHILLLLEKIFDEISTEDQVIILDRLELDIGSIRESALYGNKKDPALEDLLRAQIRRQILLADPAKPVRKMSRVKGAAAQWLFYMRYGYLPWNASKIDAAWYRQVLEAFATDFKLVSRLREGITREQRVGERILHQHPLPFLISLVEILTARKQEGLPQMLEEIAGIRMALPLPMQKIPELSKKSCVQEAWLLALKTAALSANASTLQIAQNIIRQTFDAAQLQRLSQQPLLLQPAKETSELFTSAIQQIIKGSVAPLADLVAPAPLHTALPGVPSDSGHTTEAANIRSAVPDPSPPSPEHRPLHTEENSTTEEGIFISHCGLVLLHPFLQMFFTRLGVMEGNSFGGSLARCKALYLLHFLATESTTPEEHELVMAKTLCDFPLHEPVPKDVVITQEDQEECNALLEAVIEQWAILKSTSATGLREAFLQRNGKLYMKNEQIHLLVESGPVDMLLDHLPWNLSLIKLPWMENRLHVEWR